MCSQTMMSSTETRQGFKVTKAFPVAPCSSASGPLRELQPSTRGPSEGEVGLLGLGCVSSCTFASKQCVCHHEAQSFSCCCCFFINQDIRGTKKKTHVTVTISGLRCQPKAAIIWNSCVMLDVYFEVE